MTSSLIGAIRTAASAGVGFSPCRLHTAAHGVRRATTGVVLVPGTTGCDGLARHGHRITAVAAPEGAGLDELTAATIAAVRAMSALGPVVLVGSGLGGATLNRVANTVPWLLAHVVYDAAVCPVRLATVAAYVGTADGNPLVPHQESAIRPARWGQVRHTYLRRVDRTVPLPLQDRFVTEADAATPGNPFHVQDVHATEPAVDAIATACTRR